MLSHKLRRYKSGAATDANFKQTTLLLHGDGTNGGQNNTFIDGSTNNFTITRNGNTTQGTFSPFSVADGEWSNYFDGSGDYLSVASATGINLSSGDFTIESWVYWTGSNSNATICDKDGVFGSSYPSYQVSLNGSGYMRLIIGSGNGTSSIQTITSNTLMPTNQWVHIAAVKNGTNLSLYQNGTSVASATQTATITDGGKALLIGYQSGQPSSTYWNGHISNFRIVKGTAVYTAAFTPSTTPLTAITNTSLLTCQSNNFKDNSSNNFTITRNGNVTVRPFSPFAPTAAYSASTNGGSGYFDGTGDYLTIADNSNLEVPTQDFTVEFFVYPNAFPASLNQVTILQKGLTGSSNFEYQFSIYNNTGTIRAAYSTDGTTLIDRTTTSTITLNSWNHIAYTRSGTSLTIWINGVSALTGTWAATGFTGSGTVSVGANPSGANAFNGYISNLRIVKGSRVYTSAFTPPTAPLTAITDTQLLLSCTNAAIIDNTGKNVLETVGNAQIDTGTKKFGTGALEFDGTGDGLLLPSSPDLAFGTADFTIECWLYIPSTTTSAAVIFDNRLNFVTTQHSYVNFYFSWDSGSSGYKGYYGTHNVNYISTTSVILRDVWNHVAVTRNGTTITMWFNGTSVGTYTASSTQNVLANATRIGYGQNGTTNGFIDDLRITKGIARYTANFTPPTATFEDR